jgi:hypothetical protein
MIARIPITDDDHQEAITPTPTTSATKQRPSKKAEYTLPPVLLVTDEEAAEVLRISTRLLWTLTNAGKIQCVKIGKAKRYAYSELQRFVDEATELSNANP